jgi:hypothetical protein
VIEALRDRLERVRRAATKRRRADEFGDIALRCAALRANEPRTAEDILGNDDGGLPHG